MADRSQRTGFIVVGAILTVAVAALATWLFWWRPKVAREEAQAQVAAWEKRWLPARTCILGDRPLSADAADALALAELATGSMASNAEDCTRLVGAITRPEGAEATDEVERAFVEVEAAVPAVAKAYAFRISADPDEIDRRVGDLGIAINAMDAAHDRLRAAAGLSPVDRTGGTPIARLPDPIPLVVGDHPLSVVSDRLAIRGGAIRGELYDETSAEIFVIRDPARPVVLRAPIGATPSIPDGSWMTATLPARAFDQKATEVDLAAVALPGAAQVDHAAAVLVAPWKTPYVPVAGLGDGPARAVVLVPQVIPDRAPRGGAPAFELAISSDGGKTWAPGPKAAAGEVVVAQLDPLGRVVDVVVSGGVDPDGATMTWYRLDAAQPHAPPASLVTPSFDVSGACRAGAVVWGFDPAGGVVRVAPPEVVHVEMPGDDATRLLDCTADAALIEEGAMPVVYHRCTAAGCKEAFRGSTYAYGRAAMLEDGAVAYAAGRGHLLALWKEGAADPTYFKLSRPMTLHSLVVWDGVPHALVQAVGDDALHAVALKK